MWFDFRWIDWNLTKIAQHGVDQSECEWVVCNTRPIRTGEKFVAKGRTKAGRNLHVIYLLDDDMTVFVIHARPL